MLKKLQSLEDNDTGQSDFITYCVIFTHAYCGHADIALSGIITTTILVGYPLKVYKVGYTRTVK